MELRRDTAWSSSLAIGLCDNILDAKETLGVSGRYTVIPDDSGTWVLRETKNAYGPLF